MPMAIAHIALSLPNREAWLRQLKYLQDHGVKFNRRVEHGMTHSRYINDPNGYGIELLYEVPRDVWDGDIDAALNVEWLKMFPDATARPARHTLPLPPDSRALVQADFTAVLS